MFDEEVRELRRDTEHPPQWVEIEGEDEIILHFVLDGRGVKVESRFASERAIARNPTQRLTDQTYEMCRKLAQLILHPEIANPRHWSDRDTDDETIIVPLPKTLPQPVVIPDPPTEQLDLFGNKLPF